jgi:hypothetical protein
VLFVWPVGPKPVLLSGGRMTSIAARAGVVLTIFALACGVLPAHAQFGGLERAASRFTGGSIWGSLGFRDARRPELLDVSHRHPALRGGFAALYGPFGGKPDTVVTLDSIRTTVEWIEHPASEPGAQRIDTVRTVRLIHSGHTISGRGSWVSLAIGYQYAASNRVELDGSRGVLTSTFPVGGLHAAAYFGPFRVWHAPRPVFWYTAVGATLVHLSDVNGVSETTLVRFSTERTLAPEVTLLLGLRVRPGVRVFSGLSGQRIRWSAIHYTTPSEQPLPDEVLRRLPDGLRLTSLHLILGLSFDASDLFAK